MITRHFTYLSLRTSVEEGRVASMLAGDRRRDRDHRRRHLGRAGDDERHAQAVARRRPRPRGAQATSHAGRRRRDHPRRPDDLPPPDRLRADRGATAAAAHARPRGFTGGSQIWNRGTVGGSACYANPQSDIPASARGAGRDAASAWRGRRPRACRRGRVLPGRVLRRTCGPARCSRRSPSTAPADARTAATTSSSSAESSWPIVTPRPSSRTQAGARVALGGVAGRAAARGARRARTRTSVAAAVEARITKPHSDALASGEYKQAIAGVIATGARSTQAQHSNGALR